MLLISGAAGSAARRREAGSALAFAVHTPALPMSNLRNLVKTRTYRERSQPKAREHLGLLEKKKDYVLRAKDYHRKEDALQKLREKASFRNPDEYYFNMANSKMEGGVHRKAAKQQPSHDELRNFKKEDASYLMLKQTAEARKIEKLRASLHMLDAPLQNKHTFFANDETSARALDPTGHGTTAAEAAALPPVKRSKKRRREQQQQEEEEEEVGGGSSDDEEEVGESGGTKRKKKPYVSKRDRAKLETSRAAQYSELEQRVERHSKMAKALERIGMEKALMGKGARRKLKPKPGQEGAPRKFKFKQRRTK